MPDWHIFLRHCLKVILHSLQVLKADVDAALKVLNFAVYHKELTEMDERENEREKENERKRHAEDIRDDGENPGDAEDGHER